MNEEWAQNYVMNKLKLLGFQSQRIDPTDSAIDLEVIGDKNFKIRVKFNISQKIEFGGAKPKQSLSDDDFMVILIPENPNIIFDENNLMVSIVPAPLLRKCAKHISDNYTQDYLAKNGTKPEDYIPNIDFIDPSIWQQEVKNWLLPHKGNWEILK